jgi:hypothetical protein
MKRALLVAFLGVVMGCSPSPGVGEDSSGSSTSDCSTTSGRDECEPRQCIPICIADPWGPKSPPIPDEYIQSNSTITTGGGGAAYFKITGDNNLITTDGGGGCMFDVYGNNNTITFGGGGGNVVNILAGTDNTVDFSDGGGCNSAYFTQGSLTSIIASCGANGNNVNRTPAENKIYTLP